MSGFSSSSPRACLTVLSVLALGVTATSATAATSSSDVETMRIYGGEPVETCEWPTSVGFGHCTGTLVHPNIVLTAAHCSTPTKVQFGEAYRGKVAKTIKPEFCMKNPGFKGRTGDYAFCYLKEPVKDIAIAPIPFGCEIEEVKAGASIWLVGFGQTDGGGSGVKHKVEIPINEVLADGQEINVGGDGKASCFGDSGGPAFMKMSDGSWRTVGIVSRGTNAKCGYPSVLTTAHSAVKWIQESLKERGIDDVDIAPCYDDEGNWEPTDECTGFAIDPGSAHGTWENMCTDDSAKSGKSTICAPEGEKDKDKDKDEGDDDKGKDKDKDDDKGDDDKGKDKDKDDDKGDDDKGKDKDKGDDDKGKDKDKDDDDKGKDKDKDDDDKGKDKDKDEGDEGDDGDDDGKKDGGCSVSQDAATGWGASALALLGLFGLGRRKRQ